MYVSKSVSGDVSDVETFLLCDYLERSGQIEKGCFNAHTVFYGERLGFVVLGRVDRSVDPGAETSKAQVPVFLLHGCVTLDKDLTPLPCFNILIYSVGLRVE